MSHHIVLEFLETLLTTLLIYLYGSFCLIPKMLVFSGLHLSPLLSSLYSFYASPGYGYFKIHFKIIKIRDVRLPSQALTH